MKESKRRHPDWLKVKIPAGKNYNKINDLLAAYNLNTVCSHAKCPNRGECYGNGTATFLIMGNRCTRNCRYCNIEEKTPAPLDNREPGHTARAIEALELKHVVITSVTRDDLPDNGAAHFASVVEQIKALRRGIKIELLIPDLNGSRNDLKSILNAEPDILGHNIETVKRLFPEARPKGSYKTSLELLKTSKELAPKILTKSGIMVGLGESTAELKEAITELRKQNVDILTIGQYLMPGKNHHPLKKYYTPEEFRQLKDFALELGFSYVESGPLVRSSYHAEKALQ